ncbi:MAG TPA: hypothetical protein DCZ94_07025 [Lentisphaeria bacterium]|nr:MAG: hypothetical protein A2X48_10360 [Lentisphaerae bacterium GWF2_49_21]HBC86687.1 hypothetical protein [Lentisphaeria bacterium]
MNSVLKTVIAILVCVVCGHLQAQTKIAVIGNEGDLQKEMDLLTAELSQDKDISVLERSSWNYIIREYEISKASANISGLGRKIGADTLIIIDKRKLNNADYIVSRLVSVDSGIIIDLNFWKAGADSETMKWPKAVKWQFKENIRKTGIHDSKKIPVSFLRFRLPSASPELIELENQLNALFKYRLMVEKNILVTEREDISKLVFENYLNNQDAGFKTGRYLLEGSMQVTDDGKVNVKMLINLPDGKTFNIIDSGKQDALPKLCDRLTEAFLKKIEMTSSPADWKTEDEARKYFEEAKWAFQCGLYKEAAGACESAWSLGCAEPGIQSLRIASYSYASYPIPEGIDLSLHYTPNLIDVSKDDSHIDSAITAMDLYKRYFSDKMKKNEEIPEVINTAHIDTAKELGIYTILASSRLLRCYYEQKCITKDSMKTAYLRKLLREVSEILFNYKTNTGTSLYIIAGSYIPFWQDNIKDTESEYIKLLLKSREKAGTGFCDLLREMISLHRDEHSPYFIDWSGKLSDDALDTEFKSFVNSLCKSEVPQLQADGLWFKLRNFKGFFRKEDKETIRLLNNLADANIDKIYKKELWFNQIAFEHYISKDVTFKIIEGYLQYLIRNPRVNPEPAIFTIIHLDNIHKQLSDSQLKSLHLQLAEYRKVKQTDCFNKLKTIIAARLPELETESSHENILIFDEFWLPYNEKRGINENYYYTLTAPVKNGNSLFVRVFQGNKGSIYSISKALKTNEIIEDSPENKGLSLNDMSVSDEYIVVPDEQRVHVYNRKTKDWKSIETKDKLITKTCIDGNFIYGFYLFAAPNTGIKEQGIISIDITKGKASLVTSSRRNPPETPLDNKSLIYESIINLGNNNILLCVKDGNVPRHFMYSNGQLKDVNSLEADILRQILHGIFISGPNMAFLIFKSSSNEKFFTGCRNIDEISVKLPDILKIKTGKNYNLNSPVMLQNYIIAQPWDGNSLFLYDIENSKAHLVPVDYSRISAKLKDISVLDPASLLSLITLEDRILMPSSPSIISCKFEDLKKKAELQIKAGGQK